jgi:nucleoside-diphosphate-sugar epimerase
MTHMHLSIRQHLRGKTILLTGGTGFLGKVVLERLLRAAPDVERIYLLIRESREPAAARLAEVLRAGVFEPLANTYGDRWPRFVRGTLVPVAGDVSQPRLGLGDDDFTALAAQVDIVINSAASVAFDPPLNDALLHNTRSTQYVAEFARACRSAVLLHISTAYVAGRQSGRIAEAALTDVAAAEVAAIDDLTRGILEERDRGQADGQETRARLSQAGMARARSRGWHDTYTYTKALGEMVLAAHRGTVPTAIYRPTIVESSLRDPMPGWIENLNVCDPMIVEYGRGRLPDFPLRRETVLDVVPVDLVANALVALLPYLPDMKSIGYYTIGTGAVNPLTGACLYDVGREYFCRQPMIDRRGLPIQVPHWTQPTPERFREMFADAPRSMTMKRLMYLADLYASYASGDFIFDAVNIDPVLEALDDRERALLDFDVRRIDWRSYIQDVHIPGLRRHVLKEDAGSGVGVSA